MRPATGPLETHQTRREDDIPLDECLRLFHLVEEVGITNDSGGVADFATCLVETRDDAHNGALGDIGDLCDLLEGLMSRISSWPRPTQMSFEELTIPLAHSYTTSIKPDLNFSLNSSCATPHAA